MALPLVYNTRNVAARRVGTAMTALGIGLVVFVFVWFLALSNGFKKTLVSTGRPDNLIVMRKGATSEVESYLTRDWVAIITATPGIASGEGGRPLASAELLVIANIPKRDGSAGNVSIRGVSPDAFALRPFVKIVDGRLPQPGLTEVVVGRSLARRFGNLRVGETVKFGENDWKVAGVFESGGSAFESEIWGDSEVLLPAFQREGFQSLTFRLAEPAQAQATIEALEKGEARIQVQVKNEVEYYSAQSGQMGVLLSTLGTFIAAIMSIGALFGALNTMYAAVDQRTREIATLLAIGFSPFSIYVSFVLESVLIALIGGLIGVLLALPFNGLSTGTTNWTSFSELAFNFRISPGVVASGLVFAAVLGVIGGLLPARRAARQPIAAALRAGG
jgi:ABC-type lipoprotein release transport system permease subunit